MILYVKLGNVRAVTMEWNKEFGRGPLFKRTSYHCETIVDMPYTQLIITSGKWKTISRAANDIQIFEQSANHLEGSDRDRS